LRQVRPSWTVNSEASRDASYLGPDPEGSGAGLAVISSVGVGGPAEEVGNLVVNGEEALGLLCRLDAFHDALGSSGGLMAVLCSVIQATMLPMLDTRDDPSLSRAVAGELTGDHHARCDALLLE
jgi:hypothetical protein